jgi:hypothetical protein
MGWFLYLRRLGRKARAFVDHAVRCMAPLKALTQTQEKEALKKSERLGVNGNAGVPLGRTVMGGRTSNRRSRTCRPSSPDPGSANRHRW